MRSKYARRYGVQLCTVRRHKGLTQRELAALSGIDRTTLSDLERGDRMPLWSTAVILAGALGVSLAEWDSCVPAAT